MRFFKGGISSFLTIIFLHKQLLIDLIFSFKSYLFNRKNRTKELVNSNYEDGVWKTISASRTWELFNQPIDYLTKGFGKREKLCCVIENNLSLLSPEEYYKHRLAQLQNIISDWASDSNEIVELGSGFGMNLLSLSILKKWDYIDGYEISKTGLNTSKSIFLHFGISNVKVHYSDLICKNSVVYNEIFGKICFTYLCLEQLKHSTTEIIQLLINAKVKRVIHIEPTFELLSLFSLRDILSYFHIKQNDYQDNLLITLKKYQLNGQVRILKIERLGFAPTFKNTPTLIVWEPLINAI